MVSIETVVSMLFFVLAFSYALLEMTFFFRKETQENEQVHFLKYSLFYVAGYYQMLLRALLALLFIYIFLMVYNIILVGVFKPLISDSVSSGMSKGTPYDEVISKAKEGYFELISGMAKLMLQIVFKIVDFRTPNGILGLTTLLVYVPLTIFILVTTYHMTIARPKNMEKIGNVDDARKTNYHYVTMIVLSFIILSVGVIVFASL